MQSLAEQVESFMNWRSQVDGKEFTRAAMAEAVAKYQQKLPANKRCKRQNIEHLLTKGLKSTQYIVALAKALGTTVEVLQSGEYRPGISVQEPPHADEPSAGPSAVIDSEVVSKLPARRKASADLTLPEFNTGGSMGRGVVLKDQPGVIHSWNVSEEWAHKNLPSNTGISNLCIVTGFGPSMRPLFNPGDPLVCDRGVKTIDVDAVYFFRVGEEGYIKHIQRIPNETGGVNYVVISENEKYKPWTITPGMELEVFGKVLKVWKGEEC